MATKAQRARTEEQNAGSRRNAGKKKPTQARRRPSPSKDGMGTAARNVMTSKSRMAKAAVDLEDSATKPSRKSTRGGGPNRTKPASAMRTARTIVTQQAPRGAGRTARGGR